MAALRGVHTSAWLTSAGLQHLGSALLNSVGGAIIWSSFGAALAIAVRSFPLALGLALGWALPFEHVTVQAWSGASHWYPGMLLETLTSGGSSATEGSGTTYSHAVLFLTIYAAVAAAIAL